jgi:23S rRNA pseudouridine1911/1915/1917 synthase
MVIAKTDEAHAGLAAQFKAHTITREYEALIWGSPKKPRGVIELAIGRDAKERKKFSARTARPKPSVTEYQVMARFGKTAAQVLLLPKTGRTHQIRVHLASIGHPVLGDPTYGGRKVRRIADLEIPRVMLHARLLGFIHPVTTRYQQFAAGPPSDMLQVRAALQACS